MTSLGLFNPTLIAASTSESCFVLPIDPNEPYLHDHQPGGEPLFSTVMALEAAVGAGRQVLPSSAPALLENVRVMKPYLARGGGSHALRLRVTSSLLARAHALDCAVFSRTGGDAEVHHLTARISLMPTAPTVKFPCSIPSLRRTVDAASIYDLFFHGPAFQVIAHAAFQDQQLIGRLKPSLPPSHRNNDAASETAPRLIEFGLQTAGLLELAVNCRMMIPHSIARIERRAPVDVNHPGEITSIARFGTPELSSIDIDILDEDGQLVMRIDQYRTEPLPFAINQAAVARLHQELRRLADQ